jgi:nicotinate-nucleotide adenylyltransferase
MRIGIFGGAFDPIHVGHLILAERCRDDAGLDEVWFLPTFSPPHKADRPLTRFEHRCEMVSLAITGQPKFRVETLEKELPPPSYTAATLAALRDRHTDHNFRLILGADSVADLPKWHEPRQVVERAGLIVVPRPGAELWDGPRLAAALGLPADAVSLTVVESPLVEIASRDIRKRVAEGKSVRFQVPRAVEEFIRERGLYRGW